MKRITEPELMNEPNQVQAYANANFEAAHDQIMQHFQELFGDSQFSNAVDVGCGPADISIRFAKMYPKCKIDAVDGAERMLRQASQFIDAENLNDSIRLVQGILPDCVMPDSHYDAIISNSLLHHLHNPMYLWSFVKCYSNTGSAIFIADLLRPESLKQVETLVHEYAENEPEILRRDFQNSLLAAFTTKEVQQQIDEAKLNSLNVEQISDRHMIIHGIMP